MCLLKDTLAHKYEKNIQQIILPQSNAVLAKDAKAWMQEMDKAIRRLKKIDWKGEVDYHKRSLVEIVIFRYKTIQGGQLKSRNMGNPKK